MTVAACLLLQSLLGGKRTWLFALQMSANDPKRTLSHPPTINLARNYARQLYLEVSICAGAADQNVSAIAAHKRVVSRCSRVSTASLPASRT
jgi:hypothetical protein